MTRQQLGVAPSTSSDAITNGYADALPNGLYANCPVGWRLGSQTILGTGTAAATTGVWTFVPVWIGIPMTIDAMVIRCSTARVSGTGTILMTAIFPDDGTGFPNTGSPLGSVSHDTLSVADKTTTFGSAITLGIGVYWLGALYYQGTAAPTTAPQFVTNNNAIMSIALPGSIQVGTTVRALQTSAATFTGLPGAVTVANMTINGGSSAPYVMIRRSA